MYSTAVLKEASIPGSFEISVKLVSYQPYFTGV